MQLDAEIASTKLGDTTISSRVRNVLIRSGVRTIGDLVYCRSSNSFGRIRNLGEIGKEEIEVFLEELVVDPKLVILKSSMANSAFVKAGVSTSKFKDYGYLETISIADAPLNIRVRNALQRAGIFSVGDLIRSIQSKQIAKVRNLGEKSRKEIDAYLDGFGIGEELEKGINAGANEVCEELIFRVLHQLPSSFFSALLPPNRYAELLRLNYSSAATALKEIQKPLREDSPFTAKLRHCLEEIYTDFCSEEPTRFLKKYLYKHQELLANRLTVNIIHPKVTVGKNNIKSFLSTDFKPQEALYILQSMCLINQFPSIADELEKLIALKEGELFVFITRFGQEPKTLQDVGEELGVSRERVRQIEQKVIRKVWHLFHCEPNILLKSAFRYAKDQGAEFSFDEWIKGIKEKGVLGIIQSTHPSRRSGIGIEDILFCLISSSEKEMHGRRYVSDQMRISLKSPSLTVRSIEILATVPSKKRRKIFRKIAYTGGIPLEECKKILGLGQEETHFYLEANDLFHFGNGWFTFIDPVQFVRCPILNAGLKLYEACGPLPVSEFYRGIRSYSSRFYPALAPKEMLRYLLGLYGFTFFEEKVYYPHDFKSRINNSERLFLRLLDENNGVLSFYEVVSLFIENGLSLAGATIGLLSHSPLPVRVENSPDRFTYYTLRGRDVAWDQLREASKRQIKVSANSSFKYARDGSIRYLITLSTWAVISGVLAVHSLPDLSGDWKVKANGLDCGTGAMDEALMWGISSVMETLHAELGDRIEVTFNTWDRVADFRKINHDE